MSDFYVYGLFEPKDTIDDCFYIGKGTAYRLRKHFWSWHLSEDASGCDEKIDKIQSLQEQGKKPYPAKIAKGLSEERAYELEGFLIEEIGRDNLTNDVPGGRGPFSGEDHPMYGTSQELTEETRQKISESLSGRTLSEEHKRKISESRMGEDNPMSGNEEAIQRMAESMKGRTLSKETKRKIGKGNEGYVGEKSGCNEVTNEDVAEIKYLLEETSMSQADIAEKYPIGRSRISRISTGKCWTHIDSKNKPDWL